MSPKFSWHKQPHMATKAYHQLVSSSDSSDFEDGEPELKDVPGRQYREYQRTLGGVIVVLVILVVALGTYAAKLHVMDIHVGPKPITCLCGSTTSEAETLGCKYDSLSASWLPEHCRDDELTAEFEHAGKGQNGEWPYWADSEGTMPLSLEEVGLLADLPKPEAVFYSTFGWHVAHCAFYWRKEFRMRAKGLMLENRYDRENHVEHCYPIFMSNKSVDVVGAAFGVNIGGERAAAHAHEHKP